MTVSDECQGKNCTSRTYYCPTSGEMESPCHGGFKICCDRPDLHGPPCPDPVTEAEAVYAEYRAEHVPPDFRCCRAHAAADLVPSLIEEIKNLRYRLEGLEK